MGRVAAKMLVVWRQARGVVSVRSGRKLSFASSDQGAKNEKIDVRPCPRTARKASAQTAFETGFGASSYKAPDVRQKSDEMCDLGSSPELRIMMLKCSSK